MRFHGFVQMYLSDSKRRQRARKYLYFGACVLYKIEEVLLDNCKKSHLDE